MPDLSHMWQRFLLALALVFGLALGVGATVFGYSNTAPVDLGWSVFHVHGVPLWAVVLVPLGLVLVAGTLFHWFNSLHHFTEHMRHRRRVHELEAEVESLRKHLDELLQMPGHAEVGAPSAAGPAPETEPDTGMQVAPVAVAAPEAVASNGEMGGTKKPRKRVSLDAQSEPVAVATNGSSSVASEAGPDADTDIAPDMPPTAGS